MSTPDDYSDPSKTPEEPADPFVEVPPPTPELGNVPWDDVFQTLTGEHLRPALLREIGHAGELGQHIALKTQIMAVRYAPGEEPGTPETALEQLFHDLSQALQEQLISDHDVPQEQARYVTVTDTGLTPFSTQECDWVACDDGSKKRVCTTCP